MATTPETNAAPLDVPKANSGGQSVGNNATSGTPSSPIQQNYDQRPGLFVNYWATAIPWGKVLPWVARPLGRTAATHIATAETGASNAANGVRLGQQLARESAESVFTSSGRLSSGAVAESREIIAGSNLGNKDLIQRLTSEGSSIADWSKYSTRTHQSPSGDFQVHFYMNRRTGAIDYGYDYKVIFNGVAR